MTKYILKYKGNIVKINQPQIYWCMFDFLRKYILVKSIDSLCGSICHAERKWINVYIHVCIK